MQAIVPSPNVGVVLERYDAVIREAMIQLARWRTEREEWRTEREELQRALRRASSANVQLMVIPLQATLQRAISHIDRILAQAGGGHTPQVDV